jgi:hypothetical protein
MYPFTHQFLTTVMNFTTPLLGRTEDAKFHDGNAFGRVAASGGNFGRGSTGEHGKATQFSLLIHSPY